MGIRVREESFPFVGVDFHRLLRGQAIPHAAEIRISRITSRVALPASDRIDAATRPDSARLDLRVDLAHDGLLNHLETGMHKRPSGVVRPSPSRCPDLHRGSA